MLVRLTRLEEFLGVKGFTNKLLHVSSSQEHDGQQPHQHPGEDEAEPDAAVDEDRHRCQGQQNQSWESSGEDDVRHEHRSARVGDAASCGGRGVFVVSQGAAEQTQVVEGQDEDDHTAQGDTADPPERDRDTVTDVILYAII